MKLLPPTSDPLTSNRCGIYYNQETINTLDKFEKKRILLKFANTKMHSFTKSVPLISRVVKIARF